MNNTIFKSLNRRFLSVISLLVVLVIAGAATAASNVEMDLTQSPEVSGTAEGKVKMPKQQQRMALNYVNQPRLSRIAWMAIKSVKIPTVACNAMVWSTIAPLAHRVSAQLTLLTVMAKYRAKSHHVAISVCNVMCHKPMPHRLSVTASSQPLTLANNRNER